MENRSLSPSHLVAPSLLAADFAKLESEIQFVNKSEADWFHLDVMDGQFVPNITFGMFIIEAIKKHATKPLDVHLMIVDPERFVPEFASAGADIITVHYEACNHLHRNIQQIKQLGIKAGVALNPHTKVDLLSDIIQDIDMVCLMSVNPGFGGQKFIEHTYQKLRDLRELAARKGREDLLIEIDGGVVDANAGLLVDAGANVLVAGSSVFRSSDPYAAVSKLKKAGTYTYSL
jgi:ribulose-phosphate 3-epimerase